MDNLALAELSQIFPHDGKLDWLGLRLARGEPVVTVNEVMADQRSGLVGNRYNRSSDKRLVTLIHGDNLTVLPFENLHCRP